MIVYCSKTLRHLWILSAFSLLVSCSGSSNGVSVLPLETISAGTETTLLQHESEIPLDAQGIPLNVIPTDQAGTLWVGKIEKLPIGNRLGRLTGFWTIGGRVVWVQSTTRIEGETRVGAIVGIRGRETRDSLLIAEEVVEGATVAFTGSPRSLSEDYVCYNSPVQFFDNWTDAGMQSGIRSLTPGLLRFPGGTISDYWDWMTGTIVTDDRAVGLPQGVPSLFRNNRGQIRGTLEELHLLQQSGDHKVLLTLNLITSTLEQELATLRKARDLGIPIQYVQLGNEHYFNEPNYLARFPTAESYANTVKQWIPALQNEFPGVQIAVIGVTPPPHLSSVDSRITEWNQRLLNSGALAIADAISIHRYQLRQITPKPGQSFELSELPIILGSARYFMDTYLQSPTIQILPGSIDIWITEYNITEGESPNGNVRILGSWAHGLYSVLNNLFQLEDDRITVSCLHELMGNAMWQALVGFKQEVMNPDLTARQTQPVVTTGEAFAPTASGQALALLAQATHQATQAQSLDFPESEILAGPEGSEFPTLVGWKFTGGSERIVIVNSSASELAVDVDPVFAGNQVTVEQIFTDPRTTVIQSSDVQRTTTLLTDTAVILPGYSITYLGGI